MIEATFHTLIGWLTATVLLCQSAAAAAGAPRKEAESTTAVRAVEPARLTLEQAVQLARQNAPALHSAQAKGAVAASRARQAGLWTNPELELGAEDWPVSRGRGFSDAKQTVGVAQTLPFPGKKALDRRIGRAGAGLSELEADLRATELVRDVKAAYYRALAAEQLVGVSQELAQVAEASGATARKRAEAGATAYQEQLRAEIQFEQVKSALGEWERELATARDELSVLIGRPGFVSGLEGRLAEVSEPRLMSDPPAGWMQTHPSMAAADLSVTRAQLEERRARLEPYPDVKVALSGGRIGETDQSIVQLGFSVPLPVIDRGKARQQEARAAVEIAEAERLQVVQQLQREWANASHRYRSAGRQVESYRDRILPKTTEALRLVQRGFEEGKFGFIDLLDTQRTAAEARLAYQQKLLEMNVAQAELEALLAPERLQTPIRGN